MSLSFTFQDEKKRAGKSSTFSESKTFSLLKLPAAKVSQKVFKRSLWRTATTLATKDYNSEKKNKKNKKNKKKKVMVTEL